MVLLMIRKMLRIGAVSFFKLMQLQQLLHMPSIDHVAEYI